MRDRLKYFAALFLAAFLSLAMSSADLWGAR